ncbi:MAG: NAD(P)H-binding protein [Pseudomonadales bacterium]
MKKPSLLIIGCGAIGNAIAAQNSTRSVWQLHGARRNVDKLAPEISGHRVDYTDAAAVSQLLSDCVADYLLLTFTPFSYSDEGYQQAYVVGVRNVLAALRQPPKRIVFVSSTSVYGQHNGEWVDEESDAVPTGFSGRVMLQCEQMLADSAVPSTSIRCGGIYNSTSTRLVDAVREGRFSASNHFTNRIHRYDCAAAILHLLNLDVLGQAVQACYLGVDSEPARKLEVERWLAARLGIAYPESVQAHNDNEVSQRKVGSKRCNNQRLLDSGFQFRYPDFRDGYGEVIQLVSR